MRFTVNDEQFFIEFQYERRQIQSGYDHATKQDLYRPSKNPYTTVFIWKDATKDGGIIPSLYRTATVGAFRTDRFTREAGRVNALRFLSKGNSLTRKFKAAMWEAYYSRNAK